VAHGDSNTKAHPCIRILTNLRFMMTTASQHHRPQKPAGRTLTTHAMAPALQSSTATKVSQQYRPPQVFHMLRNRHSLSWRRRSHPREIPYHLPRGCNHKLVFQTPATMYLFLATPKRQDSPQLLRVTSGA
jgi:hypothetical protein